MSLPGVNLHWPLCGAARLNHFSLVLNSTTGKILQSAGLQALSSMGSADCNKLEETPLLTTGMFRCTLVTNYYSWSWCWICASCQRGVVPRRWPRQTDGTWRWSARWGCSLRSLRNGRNGNQQKIHFILCMYLISKDSYVTNAIICWEQRNCWSLITVKLIWNVTDKHIWVSVSVNHTARFSSKLIILTFKKQIHRDSKTMIGTATWTDCTATQATFSALVFYFIVLLVGFLNEWWLARIILEKEQNKQNRIFIYLALSLYKGCKHAAVGAATDSISDMWLMFSAEHALCYWNRCIIGTMLGAKLCMSLFQCVYKKQAIHPRQANVIRVVLVLEKRSQDRWCH